MKWIARVVVFLSALVFGAFTVSLFSTDAIPDLYRTVMVSEEGKGDWDSLGPKSPVGIHVMYAGMERDAITKAQYLKFVIYNGQSFPVSYSGYAPSDAFAQIRSNGTELPTVWYCTMGSMSFQIASGRSAEVHVQPQEFTRRPRKADAITVAFDVWSDQSETGIYTSEPFLLPETFRKSIDPSRSDR